MQNIRLNQNQYYGPGDWSELDKAGLLTITAVSGMQKFKRFIPHYLVIKLFKLPVKTFWRLRECQKIQLEECLTWMANKNNLVKWLIPVISVWGKKYYGPNDKLGNITVEEFMFAEAAYTAWLDDKQTDALDTLFAALYHRHTFFGSVRMGFTERHKAAAEKVAGDIRRHVKEAIALNYAGCRNLIIDKHPHVWQKPVTDENAALLTPPMLQKVNWAALALELSGDKFGTYNQTIKMNLWLFLADMDKKAKQAKETERPK